MVDVNDLRDRLLPGRGVGDLERHAMAAVGELGTQFVRRVASLADAQPEVVLRGFGQECASDGLAQAAVGAGNEDDARFHGLGARKRAAIACWLQPTTLTIADLHCPWRRASTAATHCQPLPAARP